MANIGFATLSVIPSLRGIDSAITKQLGGPLAAAGAAGGKSLSGGLTSQLGGLAKSVVPIAAIGAAAIGSAVSVQNAQNTIIRSTGATGKAADALKKSFENVAGKTPASFQTVAAALSEVSQRTGLTGGSLEGLTRQVIGFNRITKDSPLDVQQLTKSLAGFNVPAKGMSGELDRLFKISQKTGVPLNDLVGTLGSAGPILRQFKLPVEQSASLLGKLDKAGVDSSATIGGLRHAFTTFAKAGEDPKKALIGVLGQIDGFVKAGNTVAAQQLGVKIFGARGAGIVDAAIKGKLAIGDLTKTVKVVGPGILATASSTSTLSAKLGVLKNQGQLALAKLGGPALELATTSLAALTPILSGLLGGFSKLPGPVQKVSLGLVGIAAAIGPLRKIGGILSSNVKSIIGFGKAVGSSAKSVVGFAKNIASGVGSVASFAKNVAVSAGKLALQTAAFLAQKAAALAAAVAQKAMAAAQWLLNAAMDANPIGLIVVGIAALAAGFVLAYQHITPFRNAVDLLGRAFKAAFQWVVANWPKLAAIITTPIQIAVGIAQGAWNRITGFARAAFTWVKSNWPLLLGILTGPIGLAALIISKNWDTIKRGVATVFGAVKNTFDRVVGFLVGVPGRIVKAFGDVGKLLFGIGTDIVKGLLNGITGAWHLVTDGIAGLAKHLPGPIKKIFGISSPSKVFHEIGGQLTEGLRLGIRDGMPKVTSELAKAAKQISHHQFKPLTVPKLSGDLLHERTQDPTAAQKLAKVKKHNADLAAGLAFGAAVTNRTVSPLGLLFSGAPISLVRAVEKARSAPKRPLLRSAAPVPTTVTAGALASAQPSAAVQIIVQGNVYGDAHLRKIVDAEVIPVLQRKTASKGYVPKVITSASS